MRLRSSALAIAAIVAGCSTPHTDASPTTPRSISSFTTAEVSYQAQNDPFGLSPGVLGSPITVPTGMAAITYASMSQETQTFTIAGWDGANLTDTPNVVTASGASLHVPVTPGQQLMLYYAFNAAGLFLQDSVTNGVWGQNSDGSWTNLVGGDSLDLDVRFVDTYTTVSATGAAYDSGSATYTAAYGQPDTLTATVTSGGGTLAGAVQFAVGGTMSTPAFAFNAGTSNGTSSYDASKLAVGSYVVVATYQPDTADGETHSSTSDTLGDDVTAGGARLVVSAASTTTSLTQSPLNPAPNMPSQLVATVTAVSPSALVPTGSVTFYQAAGATPTPGDPALSNCNLIAVDPVTGTAECDVTLAPGSQQIYAVYSNADGNYIGSQSNSITVDVEPSITSSTAMSSDPPVAMTTSTYQETYGAPAPTYTVVVTGSSPTGTVTFTDELDGSTPCGAGGVTCIPNGDGSTCTATCVPTGPLAGGAHVIITTYSGDGSNNGNTEGFTERVNAATPTVKLTPKTTTANVGTLQTYTATVTDPSGNPVTTGSVVFSYDLQADATHTFTPIGMPAILSSAGQALEDITFAFGAGAYDIQAVYTDTASDFTTGSDVATVTVDKLAGTLVVASDTNPAGPTQNVTYTATFAVGGSAPTITPTQPVTFTFVNGGTTTTQTGTITAGKATWTGMLAIGTYTVSASYPGDSNYSAVSTTASITESIVGNATTVALAAAPTTGTVGSAITFTATVTPKDLTSGTPSGTLAFTNDSNTTTGAGPALACATAPTLTAANDGKNSATATCTLTGGLPVGSYLITASYGGDPTNAAASRSLNPYKVVGKATTTTLASSIPGTSSYGQAVTFTATVAGATTPTGMVDFTLDGGTAVGATLASGKATFTVPTLAVGSHTITAAYLGDGTTYAGSTASPNVVQAVVETVTTIAIGTSSTPAGVKTQVTFTGTVAPAVGTAVPSGTVELFDGTTDIAQEQLVAGVATFHTSTLTAGTHSLSMQYVGDGNFVASTSTTLSQVISASAATIAVSASPSPASFGQAVTFSGTVTGALGTATGTVTVSEGGTTLGSITLASGAGSVTTSALAVGTHTIAVAYSGDGTYGTSTGSVVLVVNAASTATSLVSSANPSTVGEDVTFTATVTSNATGVTGTVELFDGQASLGSVSLTNGTASFAVKSLKAGSHTIQAQFTGTASFAGSASMAIIQVVNAATSTMDGGTVSTPDGAVANGSDASTTTTQPKAGGGCDVANGSASGAVVSLLLLAMIVLLRRRTAQAD